MPDQDVPARVDDPIVTSELAAPESVLEAVVRAVAARAGVHPAPEPGHGGGATVLDPLYSAVDPDALDALITSMADGVVTFPYAGYTVTVDSGGDVNLSTAATREPHPLDGS